MKKIRFLLFLSVALLVLACQVEGPPPSMTGVGFVTLGDSLTMGTQDAGLSREMQLNCYAYYIADQMGLSGFQQPYVDPPIGIPPYTEPFTYSGGEITFPGQIELDLNYIITTIFPRLDNVSLSRPYDNLGVNGARLVNANGLGDLTEVTTYTDTSSSNFFFDIVLRNLPVFNPDFGYTTLLEQAAMLEPDYVILWIGNNDVLNYLVDGGDGVITSEAEFTAELDRVIDQLQSTTEAEIIMANIPVNPDYLAYSHALDGAFVGGVPKLFDPTTLEAIDFGSGEYIDLVTEEIPARLLLTAAAAYIQAGAGIPHDLDSAKKEVLEREEYGLTVPDTYTPIPGKFTLTSTEVGNIETAVGIFNGKIALAATDAGIPLLDVHTLFDPATFGAGGDYDGVGTIDFVLKPGAADKTIFSLDGVHPSNLGHAIIANEFIEVMNTEFSLSIPLIDLSGFPVQYTGLDVRARTLDAVWGVRRLYGE